MSFHVLQQSYGKSKVRLAKVMRAGELHELVELSVDIELDGDFDSVNEVVDVGFVELAVRVVVSGVARLLGIGECFTKVSDGDRKPSAEAGATELISGRAMVCGAVGLLPGPTLVVRRRCSNQGIGIAQCQRVEHGVVGAADGAS